jgi:hypothetical protein
MEMKDAKEVVVVTTVETAKEDVEMEDTSSQQLILPL